AQAVAVHRGDHRHRALVHRGERCEAPTVGADQGVESLGLLHLLMSTPALKPLPSAARITARTSWSSPSERTASANSNHPATGKALTGGLSITTSATPSVTVCERGNRRFLKDRQI